MHRAIRGTIAAYENFYKPQRRCVCGEKTEDGLPLICRAHEWERQREIHQGALVKAGLSKPIPPKVKMHKNLRGAIKNAGSRVYENPVNQTSRLVNISGPNEDALAVNIAWWLAQREDPFQREHIVAWLDRTQVITGTYNGIDGLMEVLTYAPVLVFWNNHDQRNGASILNAIRSRQHGLAFVIGGV
jgi:hypothetical protein